ncbi:MAG: hypothetical protein HZC24_03880 [Rhodocyclales bacterium]|nr:hypothetical protein [Rhodocyclales bacterium]
MTSAAIQAVLKASARASRDLGRFADPHGDAAEPDEADRKCQCHHAEPVEGIGGAAAQLVRAERCQQRERRQ